MKRQATFLRGLTVLLALWACGSVVSAQPGTARPTTPTVSNVVIVRVNGQELTQADLESFADRLVMSQATQMQMRGQQVQPAQMESLRASALASARDAMINNELLKQAIAQAAADVPDADAQAEIKRFRANLQSNGVDVDEYLQKVQMTEDDLIDAMRQQLAMVRVTESAVGPIRPTDEEIRAYFDENKDKMGRAAELRTRHILFGFEGDPRDPSFKPDPAQREQLKAQAEATLAKIREGADFAEMAKEHSVCPSAARGGDLGFNPMGAMVMEYDAVAWQLKDNEISEVTETQFGFHIIQALERKAAEEADFEAIKDQLAEQLLARNGQAAMPKVYETLRKDATIEDVATEATEDAPATPPTP